MKIFVYGEMKSNVSKPKRKISKKISSFNDTWVSPKLSKRFINETKTENDENKTKLIIQNGKNSSKNFKFAKINMADVYT